jgi:polysaccharide biosynthesis protein PslH
MATPSLSLKILLILIEPPLPFGNAASRWFYVLYNELKSRGHRLDVLVASGVKADIEKSKKIFKDDANFYIYPFSESRGVIGKINTFLFPQRYQFSEDFLNKLSELNPESYDIVHIEQTWAGWVGFKWKDKVLINVHHLQRIDLEGLKVKSWKQRLIFKSWFRAEKHILAQYPYVRSCSPRLVPYIEKWGTKKMLEVVPFGIDSSLYPYIEKSRRQNKAPIVSVIGNMGWYPSYSAAERLITSIWPHVKKEIPNAQLKIVGWSARTALAEHLNKPDIEILENVADIRPYFEEASVLVYPPARGSGMKIKIQEALLFGVPVVTTSEGAEGLPAEDMVHMGLCDDDEGLIQRTLKILRDEDLQERLRINGRRFIEEQCSPQVTVDKVESMYRKMLLK